MNNYDLTIMTLYPYSLSLSWLALLATIPTTNNRTRLVLKLLTLLTLSSLLLFYVTHSAMKEELIIAPLVGVILAIFAASEPRRNNALIHKLTHFFLTSSAIIMCLVGVFSIMLIYQ